MGLRIANNIAAMNAHRQLSISDSALGKSLQRLSSGYRINSAADDAAGLAISQSFRATIASFKVAHRNTSEASSLLQVAEGGMDQIGNMLTRLKELATQSASANVGNTEREKIDSEATFLKAEIERIADSTKYGDTELLNGTFGATNSTSLTYTAGGTGGISNTNVQYVFSDTWSTAMTMALTVTAIGSNVIEGTYCTVHSGGVLEIYNSSGTMMDTFTSAISTAGSTSITFDNIGITITFTGTMSAETILSTLDGLSLDVSRTGLTSINAEGAATGVYTFSDNGTDIKLYNSSETVVDSASAGQGSFTFTMNDISFTLDSYYDTGDLNNIALTITESSGSGNTFQIGAANNTDNQISITIESVQQADLGIAGLDLGDATNAQAALDLVDAAISSLAAARGNVGAYQNRLGYAAANLATSTQNMQAAESIIRDVDMAAEMTTFTKNQILLQAGMAMLAQANMSPQQVLSLFG